MAMLDTATEDEMNDFFHQIIDQAQLKSVRRLLTGGSVEVPYFLKSVRAFQVDKTRLDVDVMRYPITQYAIPRDRLVPEGYIGTVIRICTDGMHAGYAKLVNDKTGLELQYSNWRIFDDDDDIEPVAHGPARFFNRASLFKREVPLINDDKLYAAMFLPFHD